MKFHIRSEGFVYEQKDDSQNRISVGPRCVRMGNGDILCSYMLQSSIGINDFVPTLSKSSDGGKTWSPIGPIWPDLIGIESIFCSIGYGYHDTLLLYGTMTKIDCVNEPFWNEKTNGLKQNRLFAATARYDGHIFTADEPREIPLPMPCSAEAPCAMCVTKTGTWMAPFAPYRTFDEALHVPRNRLFNVISTDAGKNWAYRPVFEFEDPNKSGAEAWIVELSNGSLLGTCWHYDLVTGIDETNRYVISQDEGRSWTAPLDTSIKGQASALHPLEDSHAMFVYNHRKQEPVGIGLAFCKPSVHSFGILHDEIVWRASRAKGSQSTDYGSWTDFSFGEPFVLSTSKRTFLIVFWTNGTDGVGIKYVIVSPDTD